MAKAFVAGASGLVGGYLIQELLNERSVSSVTALVRSPLTHQQGRLKQIKVDFSKLNEVDLDASGADLFCTLGTTIKKAGSQEAFRAVDYDAVLAFARWGFARGAKRFFIVTALGANSTSKFFYNRIKGEVEAELAKVGFESLCIFRPSLLLGPRKELRKAERFAMRIAGPLGLILFGPLAKYRPIQAMTVAKAMVAVARSATPARTRILESNEIEPVSIS